MKREIENLDPFAFAGRSDDIATESGSNERIVDEEGLALLPLLDGEPELGPLARELFEVEDTQGNLAGGPLCHPVRWAELDERYNKVWPSICREPAAKTIGGIAWRLGQIVTSLRDSDTCWDILSTAETAFADAVRLHTGGRPEGTDNQSAAALLDQWIAVSFSDCDGLDDEAIGRISGEEIRLEGAILRAEPVTIEDWKAIVAVLISEGAANVACANVEAVENLNRQLVIDRIRDPAQRERQLRGSQRRVEYVKGSDGDNEFEDGDLPAPITASSAKDATDNLAVASPAAAVLHLVVPESLAAAEQELADLWAKCRASSEMDVYEVQARVSALETWIATTAPTTLAEAAIKLRRLADPETGIEIGDAEEDPTSVRQILAFVEAELADKADGGAV